MTTVNIMKETKGKMWLPEILLKTKLVGGTLQRYSQSVLPGVGTNSETVPATGPIHGLRDFQELSQAKSHGMAGNCEARGFMNSTVKMKMRIFFFSKESLCTSKCKKKLLVMDPCWDWGLNCSRYNFANIVLSTLLFYILSPLQCNLVHFAVVYFAFSQNVALSILLFFYLIPSPNKALSVLPLFILPLTRQFNLVHFASVCFTS